MESNDFFVVGRNVFEKWKNVWNRLKDGEKDEYLERVIRPFIRKILKEFHFVGILENYKTSVEFFKRVFGIKAKLDVNPLNTSEENRKNFGYLEVDIPKIPESLGSILKDLVVWDKVLYYEGIRYFRNLLIKHNLS